MLSSWHALALDLRHSVDIQNFILTQYNDLKIADGDPAVQEKELPGGDWENNCQFICESRTACTA